MNTWLCDTTDPALPDAVGPVLAIWAQEHWGFRQVVYRPIERVVIEDLGLGNEWCLSELLTPWARGITDPNKFDDWWNSEPPQDHTKVCQWLNA